MNPCMDPWLALKKLLNYYCEKWIFLFFRFLVFLQRSYFFFSFGLYKNELIPIHEWLAWTMFTDYIHNTDLYNSYSTFYSHILITKLNFFESLSLKYSQSQIQIILYSWHPDYSKSLNRSYILIPQVLRFKMLQFREKVWGVIKKTK